MPPSCRYAGATVDDVPRALRKFNAQMRWTKVHPLSSSRDYLFRISLYLASCCCLETRFWRMAINSTRANL